ncbi:PREDICTED: RING-H2 finger protein ATL64-like [Camelina sativa]|uniref:RING-type E3 ubiquitin transferase n=1 Tax=Camelina sativa TaxID=90675 RepID=A0ABM0ZAM5_CAMSA|nr:PREDICTED: RING-H2 finger protein ATL64-like [Camelina sativa]
MLSSAIILFVAVIMILCFHTYARWHFRRQNRRIRRRIRAHLRTLSASPGDQALDPAVLEKIPIFVYCSSNSKVEKEECAVCLSEFEEEEEGRILPKCGHSFHVSCIDTWFRSRSTCPLCRAPVVHHVVEETASSSSPLRFAMEACEREPIDLVGVMVETPRDFESHGSNPVLLNQTGSKFPVLSLKRLYMDFFIPR